jgi:hypothetical protein
MLKFTRELLLSSLELERLEMNKIIVVSKYEVELFFFQVRIVLQGTISKSIGSFTSSELNRCYLGSWHLLDLIILDKGFNLETQQWIISQLFAYILPSIFFFKFSYEVV